MSLGHEVTVLEARDRVGGRVWSQELTPGRPDTIIERGAEFVLDGYDVLRGIVSRLGLALAPSGMSYHVREPRGTSSPITAADVADAARRLRPVVEATAATTSLGDFLREADIAPAASEVLTARAAISWAASEDLLSCRVLLDSVASVQPLPTFRVAGGNQGIAWALASGLGDRVLLGTPAVSVEAFADGVRVGVPGSSIAADAVVMAIPLPLLERFDLHPALPVAQRDAMARLVRGHAAKLHVPLARGAGTSAVLDVPRRFWCWTATDASGAVQPIAHCFSGSAAARAVTQGYRKPFRKKAVRDRTIVAAIAASPHAAGNAEDRTCQKRRKVLPGSTPEKTFFLRELFTFSVRSPSFLFFALRCPILSL